MSDEAITDAPPLDTRFTDEPPPHDGAFTAPPAFAPVAPTERLVNLDFARGLALLGILLVNAQFFFAPFGAVMDPRSLEKFTGADRVAFLLVMSLFASKFISIFSLLFGYGLLGQIDRAATRGGQPVWFTFRRLLALAAFGVVHALLLWYGDVLYIYAMLGAWMLIARYLPPRWLIIVAVSLLLFAVAVRGGVIWLQVNFGGQPPAAKAPQGPPPRGFDAMRQAQFNPGSPLWLDAERAAYRDGPFADAFVFRLVSWVFVLIVSFLLASWQVLGMFFLGAALYRLRFFAPEQAGLRRRLALICLPLGLAFEAAAGYFYWSYSPHEALWAWGVAGVIQQAGLLFLPLGYLSLFALAADALPGWLSQPVGNAGRMSLTVYLSETVLATALSYWWGLAWFGSVPPAQQVGLALLIWLALVLFSTVWLRFASQGPMEWLWRRLAYSRA